MLDNCWKMISLMVENSSTGICIFSVSNLSKVVFRRICFMSNKVFSLIKYKYVNLIGVICQNQVFKLWKVNVRSKHSDKLPLASYRNTHCQHRLFSCRINIYIGKSKSICGDSTLIPRSLGWIPAFCWRPSCCRHKDFIREADINSTYKPFRILFCCAAHGKDCCIIKMSSTDCPCKGG